MMLHNDRTLFERVVLDTSDKYGIAPVIVEKDYYVTLFLREIVRRQPNIIFKGGTSLSKCYHLINRFSEDIDLNIECEQKPTEGQRKKLIGSIRETILDFGFTLKNPDSIRSRRDFNRFEVDVNSQFSSEFIKHDLIVETAVFLRAYPSVRKQASSYIYEYLKSIGREDVISTFNLAPFELNVQALERTFVDKLFAICDYYLSGRIDEHSRHLYDLYKMSGVVKIDEDFINLFRMVKADRKEQKSCLSAQDNINLKACLQEIIDKDVYKEDFNNITMPLIFENADYESVKANIARIVSSSLFN